MSARGFARARRFGAALMSMPSSTPATAAPPSAAPAFLAVAAAAAPFAGGEGGGGEALDFEARDRLADQFLDRVDVFGVLGDGDGEGVAFAPGAPGAADAMHVILGMNRHVEIEDVAHVLDIEAAGGDVAADQERDLALLETRQHLVARGLGHVAVQLPDVEAVALQGLENHRHVALAVAEDQRVAHVFALEQRAQRGALFAVSDPGAAPVLVRDHDQALGDGFGGAGGRRHRDFLRVHQELVGEPADFRRHGRREKQGLAHARQQIHDLLDIGHEAHVEHAVGLVDHQDLDVGEQQPPALEQVEQAARRRDQHVGAAVDNPDLVVEGFATDQQRLGELGVLAVDDEVFGDLGGEFAGRLQDQGARHARLGLALR